MTDEKLSYVIRAQSSFSVITYRFKFGPKNYVVKLIKSINLCENDWGKNSEYSHLRSERLVKNANESVINILLISFLSID